MTFTIWPYLSLPTYVSLTDWFLEKKFSSVSSLSIIVYAILCLKNFLFSQESLSKCNFLWACFSSTTFNFKKYFLISTFSFHTLNHICSVHWPFILFFSYGIYYIVLSLLFCLFLALLLYIEFMYCHKRLQTIS